MPQLSFKKYKTIAQNTGYLSLLEVLKMALPLITMPYIIKTVGSYNYGLVVFAQTIISYFVVLVNFGLDVSAVKEVSENRNTKEKLGEVVSSVLIIKSLLLIIAFLSITGLLIFVKPFECNFKLYYFSFLVCFAEILFPIWFYQGIEKMKYITLIRFTSILFSTISIFIFIKEPSDYILIPLIQSMGWAISGIISFYLLLKVEKITLFIPKKTSLKKYFTESIPFFISRVSVLINSSLAKTICGLMFSMEAIASFDLAQKIATTAFVPLQMLNQAIFPNIAKTRDRLFATKGFLFVLFITLLIVGSIFIFGPFAIKILSDGKLMDATPILYALSFFIFSGGISLYTGAPLLVSFGKPKPFNRSVILSTFTLISLYFILYFTNQFTILNFAYALGMAEFVIAVYRLYFCYRYKILNIRWLF